MNRWKRNLLKALAVVSVGVASGGCLLTHLVTIEGPLLSSIFGWDIDTPSDEMLAGRLRTPPGFSLGLFAGDVDNPRMLRFTPTGDLVVSQPRKGRILLLEADRNGDGRSDGRRELLRGLDRPHGIDLHGEWLYVAEGSTIARVRFDPVTASTIGGVERVVEGLPAGGNHWTRTVRVGPDERLYVTVGSSCNVCIEEQPERAAMLRFRLDGAEPEVFATGLRNSVDFDWHPQTGELFASDNGRDLLGDDFPPCELNRIEKGGFYGWPFANGARVPDPDFGTGREIQIAESIAPVHRFGAHTAPLGMTFLESDRWPPAYRHAAVVALHGSWNRSRLSGYAVVSLHWGEDGSIEERKLLWGFEVGGANVIGRPVGVVEGPDGALYVSDDYGSAIYRLAWGGVASVG